MSIRHRRRFMRAALARLALGTLGVIGYAAPVVAQTTALFVDSQTGDWVGGGQRQTLTGANATFAVSATARTSVRLEVTGIERWVLEFAAPVGFDLLPGLYEFAQSPYRAPSSQWPSIWIVADSRGCSIPLGRFRVYEIEFDGSGAVSRFAADFEHRCGGTSATLFGAVRYNSTRSSLAPWDGDYPVYSLRVVPTIGGSVSGPDIACGEGATNCEHTYSGPTTVALHAIPSTGYEFLAWTGSCAGADTTVSVRIEFRARCFAAFRPVAGSGAPVDPLLHSRMFLLERHGITTDPVRQLWLGQQSRVQFLPTASHDELRLVAESGEPGGNWIVAFYGSPVSVGVYPNASVWASCPGPTRATIYELSFDAEGQVARFAADYEVICPDSLRMTGVIRYEATRSSLTPFEGSPAGYSLTIAPASQGTVSGSGIACGAGASDCEENFLLNTPVTLTAAPLPGYTFVGWTDACRGGSTTTLTISFNERCSAVFNALAETGLPDDPRLASGSLSVDSRPGDILANGLRQVVLTGVQAWWENTQRTKIRALAGPWVLVFQSGGQELRPGTYEVTNTNLLDETTPHMWVASWNGCPATGRFTVYEVETAGAGGFAVDFAYLCTISSGPLLGSLRFNSSRSTIIPFADAYPAYMIAPTAGATLSWPATFEWTGGIDALDYWLDVGTAPGAYDLYSGYQATRQAFSTSDLPLDGRTLYVRLWSRMADAWQYRDYRYKAARAAAAQITSPAPGTALPGRSATFAWNAGYGVTAYWLDVGTVRGGYDMYSAYQGSFRSATVTGIPFGYEPIWVRLWSRIGGAYIPVDYQYQAAAPVIGTIASPPYGTPLPAQGVTFSWSPGVEVTGYWITIGTNLGGGDVYSAYVGTATSHTVNRLPALGVHGRLYVRLYSRIDDHWWWGEQWFSSVAAAPGTIVSPAADSRLVDRALVTWSAGMSVEDYWVTIGTAQGGYDLYSQYQGTRTSVLLEDLPRTGQAIWIRLYSRINGDWQTFDVRYQTPFGMLLGAITSPVSGSVLGTSATLTWRAGSLATDYWIDVGRVRGGYDVFSGYAGTNLSATVGGLPTSGPIWIRLYSRVADSWAFQDFSFRGGS